MDQLICLPDLEDAINYWRARLPSQGEEARLCAQAAALARPYALMILAHRHDIAPDDLSPEALDAYRQWRKAKAA
ncbi:Protein of uncharacterised function (DUF3717) [Bordetella ansorpii]|uniref:Protein of uncharacterized function (DUF3717) n=1 Tax=Bordetella ansorpii TaxID=288768 RepID=A0A157S7B7_9BORD|nr:DUF3717 domain-containing protein [Bordetella ansorpii]SAI66318.1 Protein of uncharacterised function (DUF3717) [Bordetella ansorpii]